MSTFSTYFELIYVLTSYPTSKLVFTDVFRFDIISKIRLQMICHEINIYWSISFCRLTFLIP